MFRHSSPTGGSPLSGSRSPQRFSPPPPPSFKNVGHLSSSSAADGPRRSVSGSSTRSADGSSSSAGSASGKRTALAAAKTQLAQPDEATVETSLGCLVSPKVIRLWRQVLMFIPKTCVRIVVGMLFLYEPTVWSHDGSVEYDLRDGLTIGAVACVSLTLFSIMTAFMATTSVFLSRRANLTFSIAAIGIATVCSYISLNPFSVTQPPGPLWLLWTLSCVIGTALGWFNHQLCILIGHMLEDIGCVKILVWLHYGPTAGPVEMTSSARQRSESLAGAGQPSPPRPTSPFDSSSVSAPVSLSSNASVHHGHPSSPGGMQEQSSAATVSPPAALHRHSSGENTASVAAQTDPTLPRHHHHLYHSRGSGGNGIQLSERRRSGRLPTPPPGSGTKLGSSREMDPDMLGEAAADEIFTPTSPRPASSPARQEGEHAAGHSVSMLRRNSLVRKGENVADETTASSPRSNQSSADGGDFDQPMAVAGGGSHERLEPGGGADSSGDADSGGDSSSGEGAVREGGHQILAVMEGVDEAGASYRVKGGLNLREKLRCQAMATYFRTSGMPTEVLKYDYRHPLWGLAVGMCIVGIVFMLIEIFDLFVIDAPEDVVDPNRRLLYGVFAAVLGGIALLVSVLTFFFMPSDRRSAEVLPSQDHQYCPHLEVLRDAKLKEARYYDKPFTCSNWAAEHRKLFSVYARLMRTRLTRTFLLFTSATSAMQTYFLVFWFTFRSVVLPNASQIGWGVPIVIITSSLSVALWAFVGGYLFEIERRMTVGFAGISAAIFHILLVCLTLVNPLPQFVHFLLFACVGISAGGILESALPIGIRIFDYMFLVHGYREDHTYLCIFTAFEAFASGLALFILFGSFSVIQEDNNRGRLLLGIIPPVFYIVICLYFAFGHEINAQKAQAIRMALCRRFAGYVCHDPLKDNDPPLPPLDEDHLIDFLNFLNFNTLSQLAETIRTDAKQPLSGNKTGDDCFAPVIVCEQCLPPFVPTLRQHHVIDEDPDLIVKDGRLVKPRASEPQAVINRPTGSGFRAWLGPANDDRMHLQLGEAAEALGSYPAARPHLGASTLSQYQPAEKLNIAAQLACTEIAKIQVEKMKHRKRGESAALLPRTPLEPVVESDATQSPPLVTATSSERSGAYLHSLESTGSTRQLPANGFGGRAAPGCRSNGWTGGRAAPAPR